MPMQVYFVITPDIVLLDLAGAVQVFHECTTFGIHYELHFIGTGNEVVSSAGLGLNLIDDFSKFIPSREDIIVIPGFSMQVDHSHNFGDLFTWLRQANEKKATICSVCTGAFLLAKAGLLTNKKCTTHWRYTETLQKQFPALMVQTDKLYIKDDNIYTSAGIATGIDLALFVLEEKHGIELAMKIAREMVVYLRRDGDEKQQSVYLQYRDHTDETIHKIQDWLVNHLDKKFSIQELADIACCSPRNLTRIFKERTGITITQYITTIRVEKAGHLLLKTDLKFEHIARLCGYKSPKQLRNILSANKTFLSVTNIAG